LTLTDVVERFSEDAERLTLLSDRIPFDGNDPEIVGWTVALFVNLIVRAPVMTERLIQNGASEEFLTSIRAWLESGTDGSGVNRAQDNRAALLSLTLIETLSNESAAAFGRHFQQIWTGT
jgi:hypothetical protein